MDGGGVGAVVVVYGVSMCVYIFMVQSKMCEWSVIQLLNKRLLGK